jgi:hypothetical protein
MLFLPLKFQHLFSSSCFPNYPVEHGEKTDTKAASVKKQDQSLQISKRRREVFIFGFRYALGSCRLAQMGLNCNGHHSRLLLPHT